MTTPASPARTTDTLPGYPTEPVIEHLLAQTGIQKTPSAKLTLFMRRDFLPPDLCQAMIDLIETHRRPSTIADDYGVAAFRTSETCDMSSDDAKVREVDQLIGAFTGLDLAYGEPIQGQRYAVGQEFKAHTDYFEPSGADFHRYCSIAGNRTWTVMIYLNEPDAGGATRFKAIDKIVKPEAGKLLAWSNLRPDGTPNPSTIHHGMKVRAGTKYILTKWFRERHWG